MKLLNLLFIAGLIFSSCNTESKKECDDLLSTNVFQAQKAYCTSDDREFIISTIVDSRCPSQVVCISPGEIVLTIDFISGSDKFTESVVVPNNNQPFYEVKVFNEFKLKITKVTPYPEKENTEILLKDFRIEMNVSN
jgi:hypothetical protein